MQPLNALRAAGRSAGQFRPLNVWSRKWLYGMTNLFGRVRKPGIACALKKSGAWLYEVRMEIKELL